MKKLFAVICLRVDCRSHAYGLDPRIQRPRRLHSRRRDDWNDHGRERLDAESCRRRRR